MKLSLSPIRYDIPLVLERQGETLILNGAALDLSVIPEGATLPRAAVACDWLISDIHRVDGVLQLTLRLPHGPKAPQATLYPALITVTKDGPIALPPYEEEETMP